MKDLFISLVLGFFLTTGAWGVDDPDSTYQTCWDSAGCSSLGTVHNRSVSWALPLPLYLDAEFLTGHPHLFDPLCRLDWVIYIDPEVLEFASCTTINNNAPFISCNTTPNDGPPGFENYTKVRTIQSSFDPMEPFFLDGMGRPEIRLVIRNRFDIDLIGVQTAILPGDTSSSAWVGISCGGDVVNDVVDEESTLDIVSGDWDGDTVTDSSDNCPTFVNPGQENANPGDDSAGDVCDADYNDNGSSGGGDFSIFRACFGLPVGDPKCPLGSSMCGECDHDNSGNVGGPDFSNFRSCFGKSEICLDLN